MGTDPFQASCVTFTGKKSVYFSHFQSIDLFLLLVSGGGGVYPRLRVCRGRLTGLPNVPVHQGALWSAQLRPVVCQSPAAHSTVLPQPRFVYTLHVHVLSFTYAFSKSHVYISINIIYLNFKTAKRVLEPIQARWLQWIVRVCGSWCLAASLLSCSTTTSWCTSFCASFD